MGILEDIKRLGLKLDENDEAEIELILEEVRREKKDDLVRAALSEVIIGEYLEERKPEIMSALVQAKQKEVDEWRRRTERKYDEKGDRICDEPFCPSTERVSQCIYCGKHICKEHNYRNDGTCCYACLQERFGKEAL
jgi:hypothetical protein